MKHLQKAPINKKKETKDFNDLRDDIDDMGDIGRALRICIAIDVMLIFLGVGFSRFI